MILHVQADFEPLLVLRKIPRERKRSESGVVWAVGLVAQKWLKSQPVRSNSRLLGAV